MAKVVDLGTTSPEPRGKRWVEVPEKDLFEFPHPTIRVNLMEFGPGKHFLDAELADFVEDRIRLKYESDLRVMRPTQDFTSQNAMNRFGAGARTGGRAVTPQSLGD